MYLFVYLCLFHVAYSFTRNILYENSTCLNPNNEIGVCTQISNCPLAEKIVEDSGMHNFTRCNFVGKTEVLCCPQPTSRRLITSPSGSRKSEAACKKYYQPKKSTSTFMIFPQIFGGTDAKNGQFPSAAALAFYDETKKKYLFLCGGTIISEKYIMTAAHCLFNIYEVKLVFVRLGSVEIPESVTEMDPKLDFKVKNATIRKDYRKRTNDLALVELEKPLTFQDNIKPACLFTNSSNLPKEFLIVGWGAIDGNTKRSIILQKANVSLMSFENCKEKYRKYRTLVDGQMCAIHESSDTCEGDSGGPLFVRNSEYPLVIGVTSFGLPVCAAGNPSVYTSTSYYIDWIENIVWKDDEN